MLQQKPVTHFETIECSIVYWFLSMHSQSHTSFKSPFTHLNATPFHFEFLLVKILQQSCLIICLTGAE
jgi:hypothetical protein